MAQAAVPNEHPAVAHAERQMPDRLLTQLKIVHPQLQLELNLLKRWNSMEAADLRGRKAESVNEDAKHHPAESQ